jgi:UrcA family protein
MRRVTTTILLAALATSAVQISQAATTDGVQLSRKVEYGDLDLSQVTGTKVLYRRLLGAAKLVCAPLGGRDLQWVGLQRDCVHDAMASSVAQVNLPPLTQYFKLQHGGGSTAAVRVAMQR